METLSQMLEVIFTSKMIAGHALLLCTWHENNQTIGFFENLFNEFIVESLVLLAVAVLSFLWGRYIRKKKDNQTRAKLERHNITVKYLEKQQRKAYKEILNLAKNALNQAQLIETHSLISDYKSWIDTIYENYLRINELFHDHYFLLDYFSHSDDLHGFKNKLLTFCLIARKLNPLENDERFDIMKEFFELNTNYKILLNQMES